MDAQYAGDMEQLAEQAVAVAKKLDIDLDYSPASVSKLEEILDLFHRQIPEAKPTQEQVEEMAVGWGAYFGECIRRNFGGTWEFIDGADAIVIGDESIFVTAKVYRRITDGVNENVVALYSSIEKSHS